MITPEQLAQSGSEDGHQKALFCWANLNLAKYPQLRWLHHIPNGGSRHIIEAGKLKAMGVKRGIADIFLPVRKEKVLNNCGNGYHCGLYIELKKIGGKLSEEQAAFGVFVTQENYAYYVCHGWEAARDTIVAYLEGK